MLRLCSYSTHCRLRVCIHARVCRWLYSNQLTGPLPREWGAMTSLQELWVAPSRSQLLPGPARPLRAWQHVQRALDGRIGVYCEHTKDTHLAYHVCTAAKHAAVRMLARAGGRAGCSTTTS
jgi:hypothetical protein